jgi:hypothetical protein
MRTYRSKARWKNFAPDQRRVGGNGDGVEAVAAGGEDGGAATGGEDGGAAAGGEDGGAAAGGASSWAPVASPSAPARVSFGSDNEGE